MILQRLPFLIFVNIPTINILYNELRHLLVRVQLKFAPGIIGERGMTFFAGFCPENPIFAGRKINKFYTVL